MKVKIKGLSFLEQNIKYGKRKIEVGKCYKKDKHHFYCQYENYVLHIYDEEGLLINTMVEGFLNSIINYCTEITEYEFNNKVKEVIYNLSLDTFWKKH